MNTNRIPACKDGKRRKSCSVLGTANSTGRGPVAGMGPGMTRRGMIGGADVDEHSTENMQHCPVEPNISWEDWIRNVCQDYMKRADRNYEPKGNRG